MLWKGPLEDGVTQSLLCKFLVCRHRFYLKVVKGLKEEFQGFPDALEYGNLWHECEEAYAGGFSWQMALKAYTKKLQGMYPTCPESIHKWYNVCKQQFPAYIDYWKNNPQQKAKYPIFQEEAFAVEYELPSGRVVLLRGKFDEVDEILDGVWLQENKTKGQIDQLGLTRTIGENLQSMFYQIALREGYETDVPVCGTLYNVVQRPLGMFYGVRKSKKETKEQFWIRLGKYIRDNPEKHFFRWTIPVFDYDLERFKKRTFHPVLESLYDWWEWIVEHPEDPWGGPHFMYPYGVYNSLSGGYRGDYFDYLTTGSDAGLYVTDTLFPEL